MTETKKTVAESEREAGIILNTDDERVLNSKLTREEWDKVVDQYGHRGVQWDDRSAWLKANGYDVTRENLRNADLPSQQQ